MSIKQNSKCIKCGKRPGHDAGGWEEIKFPLENIVELKGDVIETLNINMIVFICANCILKFKIVKRYIK